MKFTIRDLLWLTVVALGVAWWVDHASCVHANYSWMKTAFELERKNQELLTRLRDSK
jgi:hypothetical protein